MPRGEFTGDVLNQGYGLARNSSRVLAPPGGASSDIFGTGSVSYNHVNDRPTAVAAATRNDSTVFRSPIRAAAVNGDAATRRGKSSVFSNSPASPQRRGRAEISHHTGAASSFANFALGGSPAQVAAPAAEPAPASPARAKEVSSTDFKPAGGKSRAVHTSSRVSQPPGGKCHNIFG